MKQNKKNFALLLVVVLLASIISGCSGQSQDKAAQDASQELIIGYGLDTGVNSPRGTGDMLLKIMTAERLVESVDGKLQPGLATSWEITDEGRTIVFHLRKNVSFADGTPFTADTVKFIYDRLKHFKDTSWTELDRIESLEIIDPHTIAFHFTAGKAGYIALTAFAEYQWSIFSPKSVQPAGDPAGQFIQPIGTGPWKVADYQKDQYTVFVPNEYYHGEKPKLSRITVKDIPDGESRVLALQSGNVDVIVDYYHGGSAYTPRNLLKSLQDQGFQVLKKEMPMTTVVVFNYKKQPWDEPRVRKAVNYAINKEEVVALFDGWIRPAEERVFSDLAPYMKESEIKEYSFNPVEAKKLLQEAGLAQGFQARLILQGENPDEVKLGEVIKAQLAKVGIDVQLAVLEGGAYKESQDKGNYDLRIYYIGGPERRRYTRVDGRFNPNAPEFKFGAFDAPEITPVLEKAVTSFHEDERRQAFKEFYRLLREEAGVVPLYYDAVFVVAKPNVKNIEYVSSEPRFDKVIIEKK